MCAAGRLIAAFAVLAGLGGCATRPACPKEGGPPWSAWLTPHFRIVTDLGPAAAEPIVDAFEDMRAAVVAAAWRAAPEPREPLEVVVFRTPFELEDFDPSGASGRFMSGPLGRLIITHGGGALLEDEVIKHEIVHGLADQLGLNRGAPRWLAEGLAEYLSATHYAGRNVVFGDANAALAQIVAGRGVLDLDQLWSEPWPEEDARFYATSWLLVHYLFNHQRARFEVFQTRVPRSPLPRALWAESFPELTGPGLKEVLDGYFDSGSFTRYEVTRARPRVSTMETALRDADVHALRALLYAMASDPKDALVRAEVSEALVQDELNVRARSLERFYLHLRRDDVGLAQRVVEGHSSIALAWVALADAHAARGEAAESRAALDRAIALGFEGDPSVLVVPRAARPY